MDDIAKELKLLNAALQRLTDFFVPGQDLSVLDRFKAFRGTSIRERFLLSGIRDTDPVELSELRGIDDVVTGLRENTEQLLQGLPCNNVLLYGPRGTGKSSAIKALVNEYGKQGLRIIEMPRDTLLHLPEVEEMVRNRKEKYIVFCDDMSFEEDDQSYRHLKTVLEGGLEMRPQNMVIYATSNRRHLMPEKTADNLPVLMDGELHPAETLEEKISLSDRFGLRFGLPYFGMETYLDIVLHYADIRKLPVREEELRLKAMQWSISHGSFAGRTARQFIDDLEGKIKLKTPRRKRTVHKRNKVS